MELSYIDNCANHDNCFWYYSKGDTSSLEKLSKAPREESLVDLELGGEEEEEWSEDLCCVCFLGGGVYLAVFMYWSTPCCFLIQS